jgi:hypothetical protein
MSRSPCRPVQNHALCRAIAQASIASTIFRAFSTSIAGAAAVITSAATARGMPWVLQSRRSLSMVPPRFGGQGPFEGLSSGNGMPSIDLSRRSTSNRK